MATVQERSRNTPIDKKMSPFNRKVTNIAGTVPLHTDEVVLDTTTGELWRSLDLTATGWVKVQVIR